MTRRFLFLCTILLAAGTALLAYALRARLDAAAEFRRQAELAREQAEQIHRETVVPQQQKIPRGSNFVAALERFGLSALEANEASAAAQRAFNLRQVRAGHMITVGRSVEGQLRSIEYQIDPDHRLRVVPAEGRFDAQVEDIPLTTQLVAVNGELSDSLFNAVEDAGESADLAMQLAQIFGYDLDFYTDPRRGDTFRVVLEKKKSANGQTAGYGRIFAAEYDSAGRTYQALLFHDAGGRPAYYAADGKSLQKMFLRSPLKFGARITAHFSRARFHPILKFYRPHLGIDYGAPIGTPVQTIGTGRVLFVGRRSGEGNMVRIAHASGYETMYLHLSRIFVRPRQRVEIGKTIGLVGSTGLSTGPHLDFRILQRGQYKNFEKLGLPPADPVSKRDLPEFQAVREKWLPLLKTPGLLQAQEMKSDSPATSAAPQ